MVRFFRPTLYNTRQRYDMNGTESSWQQAVKFVWADLRENSARITHDDRWIAPGRLLSNEMSASHHPRWVIHITISATLWHYNAWKVCRGQPSSWQVDKSHICPDQARCATPTKVVVWVGECQVSSKSVQGFCLPARSKSAIFLCLALWLT